MAWARASELDRLLNCPASGHLPRLAFPSESRDSAAEWGTAVHGWKEGRPMPEKWRAVWKRRETALAGAGLTVEDLWPGGTHEIPVALTSVGGVVRVMRALEHGHGTGNVWKAAQPPEYVTGSLDFLGEQYGTPWVDDLKTGREVPEDPLALNQMRFYATAALYLTHAPEVLVSLTHWPRYPADGLPRRGEYAVWTRDDARAFTERLETARLDYEFSRATEPDARPGDHCLYCPCAYVCPKMGR